MAAAATNEVHVERESERVDGAAHTCRAQLRGNALAERARRRTRL